MDSKWHYIWFCIIHRNFIFHKQISPLGNTTWNPVLDLCRLLRFDLLMRSLHKLLHKLKSLKFVCFSLENLPIAMLLNAFPRLNGKVRQAALIRHILTLFSSHSNLFKGLTND